MNTQTQLKERIPAIAFNVLVNSTEVSEGSIKLTCGQLDPADYAKVNEVIERIGGKWNGRKKAHLFSFNPRPIFDAVIETGLMPAKNPLAFFPTPAPVADELVAMLELFAIPDNPLVLDPSVGQAALVDAFRRAVPECRVHACELDELNQKTLEGKQIELVGSDFLKYQSDAIYDVVIMNPPFSVEGDKKAWITHFNHAYSMLKPDGQLLLISPVFSYQEDKKTQSFRDVLNEFGHSIELEDGAFAASGTKIKTCLCHFKKTKRHIERNEWEEPREGFFSGYVADFFLTADSDYEVYQDVQRLYELNIERMQELTAAIERHVEKWYAKFRKEGTLTFHTDWRKVDRQNACMDYLERWAEHWQLELKFPASHYFNLPPIATEQKTTASKLEQLELFT